jgi:hypothetical protein
MGKAGPKAWHSGNRTRGGDPFVGGSRIIRELHVRYRRGRPFRITRRHDHGHLEWTRTRFETPRPRAQPFISIGGRVWVALFFAIVQCTNTLWGQ